MVGKAVRVDRSLSVFTREQEYSIHEPEGCHIVPEIAEGDLLTGDALFVAIGTKDGEARILEADQIPDLEGFEVDVDVLLVADDEINEPVGAAGLGHVTHAIGINDFGKRVPIVRACAVGVAEEVVCFCHKKFVFKRKNEKRKQPGRRCGGAAKKQRNKRGVCVQAKAPTRIVGAQCLWRNFFAAAGVRNCANRLVCFAFFI